MGFALGLVGGAGQRSLAVMSMSSHPGGGGRIGWQLTSLCGKPRTLGGNVMGRGQEQRNIRGPGEGRLLRRVQRGKLRGCFAGMGWMVGVPGC